MRNCYKLNYTQLSLEQYLLNSPQKYILFLFSAYRTFSSYIMGTVQINSLYYWQSDNTTQLQTWGWKPVLSYMHDYGRAVLLVVSSSIRFASTVSSDFSRTNTSTICEWPK